MEEEADTCREVMLGRVKVRSVSATFINTGGGAGKAKKRQLSVPNIHILSNNNVTATKLDIISFSFDSSGWLYLYHLGVAKYLSEHFDLQHPNVRFYGCSAGSIVALALALNVSVDEIFQRAISGAQICKYNPFKMFGLMEQAIKEWTSEDTHKEVSGKLSVSLAKLSPRYRLFSVSRVSKFESRDHLLSAIRASCHIPLVGGVLPKHVDGIGYCYDGGLVERIPKSPHHDMESKELNETCIKISASGLDDAHIKNSLSNPVTLGTIPPTADKLHAMFHLGYNHAVQFFENPDNSNHALEKIRKISPLEGAVIPLPPDIDIFSDEEKLLVKNASPRRRTLSQVSQLENEVRDLAQSRKKKITRASQVVLILVLVRIFWQVAV